MRNPQELIRRFRQRRHVVDGGLATELERRGHDISGKLWSGHVLLNDASAVEQLHYDYLTAGADIIISSSYQLSLQGMMEAGYSADQARRALELSIESALKARERWLADGLADGLGNDQDKLPLIAASIGPYGAYLADGSEYTGDYDLDYAGLCDFHRERVELLVETDADLIAFETVPALSEALAITALIKDCDGPPAWISFACRDGEHLCDGTKVADAADSLLNHYPGLVAIGVNCTPPRYVESILANLGESADAARIPLVAYPNSGEGWNAVQRCWIGENDPLDFSDYARCWIAAGANLIGGCCRTGPDHIAGLHRLLAQ